MLNVRTVPTILVSLVTLVTLADAAAAKKKVSWRSYAVPFSCGQKDATGGNAVAGTYAAAVTITNPDQEVVSVRARFQLTDPSADASERITRTVNPGETIQIDCDTIRDEAFVLPVPLESPGFFQGLLTLGAETPLSVVSQSSATGSGGDISYATRQIPGIATKFKDDGGNGSDPEEIEICHIPPGNPGNRHTILVEESDLSGHLGHGDDRGACDGGS